MSEEGITNILSHILPPITERDMQHEYRLLLASLGSRSNVDEYELFDAVMHNRQWIHAGEMIIKEFVYLDSIRALVVNEDSLLSNECLSILKEDLECNLSRVTTYSNEEVLYLFATSFRDRKMKSLLCEDDYQELEQTLAAKLSDVYAQIKDTKRRIEQDIHESVIDYLFHYPISKF